MEINFNELKKKDVINLIDGRHLGRVCDITFCFPESEVIGFTVTGCKGFKFSKQEVFLPINTVVKIGQDAMLVKFGNEEPPCPPPRREEECRPPRRDNCEPRPPQYCPPCPPPNNCPPKNCPPSNRRSYDEYE